MNPGRRILFGCYLDNAAKFASVFGGKLAVSTRIDSTSSGSSEGATLASDSA